MIVPSKATRSLSPSRTFWLATAGSISIAVAISLAVSFLWRLQGWRLPYSVAVTSFLFVSGMLRPTRPDGRRQSWRSRVLLSLALAIVIGGAYTLVFRA
jgi:hypothetical protein